MPSCQLWTVVGGKDRGGILVRSGRELGSPSPYPDARISCGALVEEQELVNGRLCYKKLSGTGPETGWVSLYLKDKPLLAKADGINGGAAGATDASVALEVSATKEQGKGDAKAGGRADEAAKQEPGEKSKEAAALEEEEVRMRMVGGLASALPGPLKRLLNALERPLNGVLGVRSEIETGRATGSSAQRRLSEQEMVLQRALEDVRAAAEHHDPPASRQSRSSKSAMQGGRLRALTDVDLDEAVRLVKLSKDVLPRAVRDNTWLESNPKWSKSGKAAIGKWVSSIIDEEGGNPDTAGPQQLLDGGSWISRRMKTSGQWIVFDLGQPMKVSEVRTRGHYANSGCNPRKMQWQTGTKLDGSWKTAVSFDGTPNNDWAVGRMEPPVKSRYWRLYMNANGGRDYAFMWLYGFSLRLVQEPQEPEEKDDEDEEPAKEADKKDTLSKDGKDAKESKEGKDAESAKEEGKDDHKRLTKDDLRKNDVGWEQLTGYGKLAMFALLYDRCLTFEETPYIDMRWHSAEEYTKAFLSQNELVWKEAGWSLDHDPNFFCELAYEGFNPIGLEIPWDNDVMLQVLSPCFEPKRSVLDCVRTHVSKRTLRLARHYTLTVDHAYDDVMLGCINQHGEGWLYRGVRSILRTLWKQGYTGKRNIPIDVHSFELWDSDGRLVAGDLGYTMGSVYVSQTGFHRDDTKGLGEVQLVLTAALLHKLGHKWFDMGQFKEYKAALGALTLDPHSWLERFRGVRDLPCSLAHDSAQGADLLDHLLRAIAASQDDWPSRVLRLPGRPEDVAGGARFTSVCVFGPYHSCTNALVRELPRFFDVTVVDNESYRGSGKLWKHQVLKSPPPVDGETLCICLVKDPAFWIQSLAREPESPRCSSFYELLPVRAESTPSGETKLTLLKAKDAAQLFNPVVFREELFVDALGVWEATARSYLDERLMPRDRTAIIRCEDYIFSFAAVMKALAQRGLPLKEDAPTDFEPLSDTAKDETHPELTRRARPELLKYYADPANRLKGLDKAHQVRLRRLDRAIVQALGYGEDAVASWLPAPGQATAAAVPASACNGDCQEQGKESKEPKEVKGESDEGPRSDCKELEVEPCPQDGSR